jgi:uncharacterized lipoprotein YehR (DUF1307 family)
MSGCGTGELKRFSGGRNSPSLMLTCTYRGVSYQIPARQSKTQELGYDCGHYIDRVNEAQKQMIYRGINHSFVSK